MSRFLKRDPLKRAKKHVDKALNELEEGYPDYASVEYEKAASLFLESEEIDFAVKYFREASYCALEANDHSRGANMKSLAADALLADGRYDEGGAGRIHRRDRAARVHEPPLFLRLQPGQLHEFAL